MGNRVKFTGTIQKFAHYLVSGSGDERNRHAGSSSLIGSRAPSERLPRAKTHIYKGMAQCRSTKERPLEERRSAQRQRNASLAISRLQSK